MGAAHGPLGLVSSRDCHGEGKGVALRHRVPLGLYRQRALHVPNAIDAVNAAVFTMDLESPTQLHGIPANVKVDRMKSMAKVMT